MYWKVGHCSVFINYPSVGHDCFDYWGENAMQCVIFTGLTKVENYKYSLESLYWIQW